MPQGTAAVAASDCAACIEPGAPDDVFESGRGKTPGRSLSSGLVDDCDAAGAEPPAWGGCKGGLPPGFNPLKLAAAASLMGRAWSEVGMDSACGKASSEAATGPAESCGADSDLAGPDCRLGCAVDGADVRVAVAFLEGLWGGEFAACRRGCRVVRAVNFGGATQTGGWGGACCCCCCGWVPEG